MQIYSYHLYNVNYIQNLEMTFQDLLCGRGYDIEFISENCFVVRNEDKLYLTAFPSGEVKFFAKEVRTWERFYIIDKHTLKLIDELLTQKNYKDKRGNEIQEYNLFLDLNRLHISLGATTVTPSFMPAGKLNINQYIASYQTLEKTTYFSKQKILIYFCIYGKDEYYQMFELSLKSLIEIGEYTGDILIKTDDMDKVKNIISKISGSNNFYISKWKEKLEIFNRFDLCENILDKYTTIVYFDSDILVINPLTPDFWNYIIQGDISTYIELEGIDFNDENMDWFALPHLQFVKNISNFYTFNSGFFAINNLEKVRESFDNIINYRVFERKKFGDQPYFNMSLYNANLDVKALKRDRYLSFSRSIQENFRHINNILLHYNGGVGRVEKLDLMKHAYSLIAKK